MDKNFSVPILLIIFNRPEKARLVLEAVRQIKPSMLFIAADGPRKNKIGEKEKCLKSREIINQIDWPCDVKTNFLDENIGCDPRVSSAVNWFFEYVDNGIILEDDCLASKDFFTFCEELLNVYRYNYKVMMISGDNFQDGIIRGNSSYYFSSYANTWGWATWKRAWVCYQENLDDLETFKKIKKIKKILPAKQEIRYWIKFFNKLRSGKYTFWDAKWTFSIWNAGGVTIVPNKNLVSNIGHDSEGTHTIDGSYSARKIDSLEWPLSHPVTIEVDTRADRYLFASLYRVGIIKRLYRKVIFEFKHFKRKISWTKF